MNIHSLFELHGHASQIKASIVTGVLGLVTVIASKGKYLVSLILDNLNYSHIITLSTRQTIEDLMLIVGLATMVLSFLNGIRLLIRKRSNKKNGVV